MAPLVAGVPLLSWGYGQLLLLKSYAWARPADNLEPRLPFPGIPAPQPGSTAMPCHLPCGDQPGMAATRRLQ